MVVFIFIVGDHRLELEGEIGVSHFFNFTSSGNNFLPLIKLKACLDITRDDLDKHGCKCTLIIDDDAGIAIEKATSRIKVEAAADDDDGGMWVSVESSCKLLPVVGNDESVTVGDLLLDLEGEVRGDSVVRLLNFTSVMPFCLNEATLQLILDVGKYECKSMLTIDAGGGMGIAIETVTSSIKVEAADGDRGMVVMKMESSYKLLPAPTVGVVDDDEIAEANEFGAANSKVKLD